MSDFWDQVQEYADNAPEAGYANVNYGKLKVTPMVVKWSEKDGVRTPEKKALKDGQEIKKDEALELNFNVEIAEFNPKLEFAYERNVPVRKSGRIKSDWAEIVLPSLEATFGKQWAKAVVGKIPYVCIEDFPNVAGKASATGKVYGVPKILAVYKNKAECGAAREERFKSTQSAGAAVAAPDEGDDSPAITDAISQVKALISSVGVAKAKKMLENKPFGEFEPDALIELAQA